MKPEIYILKNDMLEVHISTLGATLTRIITNDKYAHPVDVLLGFDNAESYMSPQYLNDYPYMGAAIGRYANRIAKGKFAIDGKEYQLAVNNGENHLHGGISGFDKKIWTAIESSKTILILTCTSADGEENYPGNLSATIRFMISNKELRIDYHANVDKKCYVSLTHHPYFNLNANAENVKEHKLKLYTKKYLRTNNLIPDGTFVEAENVYDFSNVQRLGNAIEQVDGLDDCYVFDNNKNLARVAELSCEENGIKLYVKTTYPGLQVYTGKYLNVANAKCGKTYGAFAGVALEAQYFPDSPNHPNFPQTLLLPGEEYNATTIYGFE